MNTAGEKTGGTARRAIVSSAHLAQSGVPELSEMEFALNIGVNAFNRWIVRGMAAAGVPDVSALDVQVLHVLHHRERPKRMADICLMLNLEDTHTVAYALKKLEKAGLVKSARQGKEKIAEATDEGRAVCERYREIREECLLASIEMLNVDGEDISRLAGLLRALSGLYDQAARAATSL
jgi:predicted MarR family transcription regulator